MCQVTMMTPVSNSVFLRFCRDFWFLESIYQYGLIPHLQMCSIWKAMEMAVSYLHLATVVVLLHVDDHGRMHCHHFGTYPFTLPDELFHLSLVPFYDHYWDYLESEGTRFCISLFPVTFNLASVFGSHWLSMGCGWHSCKEGHNCNCCKQTKYVVDWKYYENSWVGLLHDLFATRRSWKVGTLRRERRELVGGLRNWLADGIDELLEVWAEWLEGATIEVSSSDEGDDERREIQVKNGGFGEERNQTLPVSHVQLLSLNKIIIKMTFFSPKLFGRPAPWQRQTIRPVKHVDRKLRSHLRKRKLDKEIEPQVEIFQAWVYLEGAGLRRCQIQCMSPKTETWREGKSWENNEKSQALPHLPMRSWKKVCKGES